MPSADYLELISAAERFTREALERMGTDPSHDWHHVHRVRQLSLALSRCSSLSAPPDLLVLELAALFHDVADAKYAVPGTSASSVLGPFFEEWTHVVTPDQRRLVERICANVSWSKDEKRRRARAQAEARGEEESGLEKEEREWRETCPELACVSDADRLDAIGSIGIMRVSAFSAARQRPLYIPPANAEGDSVPPAEQGEGYNGSAVAHFHEKLLKIKGDRLSTDMARAEAERRQGMMRSFLTELDLEWMFADQGAQLVLMQ
ncbi:hypothetical protein FA09DRAFT_330158 [Tilletiopsis washingtonensis]|uniref:HD/PDEase domain-containing protein n=1 Tax=Tilletiopsis washingtonensis TaxID=58919 RepID=A0A316Z889_9BASI|nr:hypothetical protein FA09DRAFT_330158 [Tilletiopsis washingtonensis]PWN98000.1 hypothetical protein FA09DRAFT_330158 [Tilletiopsis washingtonensis]